MKKAVCSLFLTMALVLGVVFAAAPQAQAATHSHCVCGGKAVDMKDHTCDADSDRGGWKALTMDGTTLMADGVEVGTITTGEKAKNSAFDAVEKTTLYELESGKYYLSGDLKLQHPLSAKSGAQISICLNGHNLSGNGQTNASGRVFVQVNVAGTINLTDCTANQGQVTSKCGVTGAIGLFNNDQANFNLYAGDLVGNRVNAAGGVLRFFKGNMNMYGGILQKGNSASFGGNLYVASGTYNMYGGLITNGISRSSALTNDQKVSTNGGGNVRITAGSTFNMYGGTISNGKAENVRGGNILVNGKLYLYGGTIIDGTDSVGASIYIDHALHKTRNTYNYGSLNGRRDLSAVDTLMAAGKLTVNGAVVVRKEGAEENQFFYKLYSNTSEQANPVTIDITKVMKNDLTIDINGFDFYADIIPESGKKIYGIDSGNDSFDAEDCGKLIIKDPDVTVQTYIQEAAAGNKHYIAIAEGSNTYTFHRVSVALKNVSLEIDEDSVNAGYTAQFQMDDVIKALLQEDDSYGFNVYLLAGGGESVSKPVSEFLAGKNTITLRLSDIMKRDGTLNTAQALVDIKAKTYMDIGDLRIESKEFAFNLKEMIEAADAKLSQLDQKDRDALVDTYKNYVADMKSWNIPNLKQEANVEIEKLTAEKEAELRDKVAAYMEQVCSLQWKLENDIARSCGGTCHADGTLKAGDFFEGMPYTHRAASLEKFRSRLDSNDCLVLADGETVADIGNDCADAVYWAWSQVSAGISFTLTNNAMCYNGTIPVGNYTVTGQETTDSYNTKTVCNANGEQTMYEAYAKLKKGDALLRAIPNGHMLMVTRVVYDRNTDGTIDGGNSWIYFMEQGSTPTAESGSHARTNGSITFSDAFNKDDGKNTHYIPLTIAAFTQGADPEQVYVCNKTSGTLEQMMESGYVTSNYRINSVSLKIDGVDTVTEYPYSGNTDNGNVVQLSVLKDAIDKLGLTAGTQYTYEIIVHVGDADVSAQTGTFTA